MRNKPRSIEKWGLTPKDEKKVKKELNKWLQLLITQAKGREGNVHRADFIREDFFYFTDCTDILKDDPECKSVETNPRIRARKQKVMCQLLIKNILGINLTRELKCTHCGSTNMRIDSTVNGHFTRCKNCEKISLVGYTPTLGASVEDILSRIDKEVNKND